LKLDEEPPKKVVDELEEKAAVEEDQRLPKKVVKEKDQSKEEVDDVMSKMKKDPDPESYQPIRKKSGAEMQGELLA
jgi:rRNA maturation endonuclease Nob1